MHPQNIRAAGVIQLLGGVGPQRQRAGYHFNPAAGGAFRLLAWLLPSQVLSTPWRSAAVW